MAAYKTFSIKLVKSFLILAVILFSVVVLFVPRSQTKTVSMFERASADSLEIYKKNCAQCHGLDGRARTAKGKRLGATNFTGTDWNTDDARGIRIITNGKGDMPSFKGKLNPGEIKSVWEYVRRFR